METNTIIFFDESKYQDTYARHEQKVEKIQLAINQFVVGGLQVPTTEELKDLLNHGKELYNKAQAIASEEAVRLHKIQSNAVKFESETLKEMYSMIDFTKKDLLKIMLFDSMRPLEIEAFEIQNGIVSISNEWNQSMKSRFTIENTPERAEAFRLANNLKTAIDEINQFVSTNQAFKAGFGIAGSGFRTLCSINNSDWGFNILVHEFEYV